MLHEESESAYDINCGINKNPSSCEPPSNIKCKQTKTTSCSIPRPCINHRTKRFYYNRPYEYRTTDPLNVRILSSDLELCKKMNNSTNAKGREDANVLHQLFVLSKKNPYYSSCNYGRWLALNQSGRFNQYRCFLQNTEDPLLLKSNTLFQTESYQKQCNVVAIILLNPIAIRGTLFKINLSDDMWLVKLTNTVFDIIEQKTGLQLDNSVAYLSKEDKDLGALFTEHGVRVFYSPSFISVALASTPQSTSTNCPITHCLDRVKWLNAFMGRGPTKFYSIAPITIPMSYLSYDCNSQGETDMFCYNVFTRLWKMTLQNMFLNHQDESQQHYTKEYNEAVSYLTNADVNMKPLYDLFQERLSDCLPSKYNGSLRVFCDCYKISDNDLVKSILGILKKTLLKSLEKNKKMFEMYDEARDKFRKSQQQLDKLQRTIETMKQNGLDDEVSIMEEKLQIKKDDLVISRKALDMEDISKQTIFDYILKDIEAKALKKLKTILTKSLMTYEKNGTLRQLFHETKKPLKGGSLSIVKDQSKEESQQIDDTTTSEVPELLANDNVDTQVVKRLARGTLKGIQPQPEPQSIPSSTASSLLDDSLYQTLIEKSKNMSPEKLMEEKEEGSSFSVPKPIRITIKREEKQPINQPMYDNNMQESEKEEPVIEVSKSINNTIGDWTIKDALKLCPKSNGKANVNCFNTEKTNKSKNDMEYNGRLLIQQQAACIASVLEDLKSLGLHDDNNVDHFPINNNNNNTTDHKKLEAFFGKVSMLFFIFLQ